MDGGLRIGTAVADITPQWPVMLHGYADRDRLSDGVIDPVYVRCLAISSSDRTVLLLTFDMIGIRAAEVATIQDIIKVNSGVEYPDILLACSHSHFAPALSVGMYLHPTLGLVEADPGFTELVHSAVAFVVAMALSCRRPASLSSYRVKVPELLFNRRTILPDGKVETNFRFPTGRSDLSFGRVDDELSVMRFTREHQRPAYMLNYGCHPVTGGADNEDDHYKVSSDYVHWIRKTTEEIAGASVLFTLGAAGDAVPLDRYGYSRRMIGSTLANAALLGGRKYSQPTTTPELKSDAFNISVRTILRPGEFSEDTFTAIRQKVLTDRENPELKDRFGVILRSRHRDTMYPDGRFTIPIQILQIGEVILVALPFEVLSEFSLKMKSQFPRSMLVSCANGYEGYLPFAHEYERGGYEATERSTHFEIGTAEKVYNAVIKKLAQF